MKNFEIELRYEILNPAQLQPFVASMCPLGTKRTIDIYFDNPNLDLCKTGVFVRERNGKILDIKFNRDCLNDLSLPMQPYCEEYSFALPLQENDLFKLNEILEVVRMYQITFADYQHFKERNNLGELYRIDKTRTSYSSGEFTICIDEVAELGTFLEIELMADNVEDLEQMKLRMEQLLLNLEVKKLRTGYGTLLLKKKNYEIYRVARFARDEEDVC